MNKAYSYLIKILSARDYSEHKLREKLRERKFPATEIDSAINEIKDKGYLKEEVYTEARIKGFMAKGYSPDYIRQKLAQEHLSVSIEFILDVFLEHNISTEQQIERLARKKIGQRESLDFDSEGKILRFLISKGHDFGTARKVLKSITSNLSPE